MLAVPRPAMLVLAIALLFLAVSCKDSEPVTGAPGTAVSATEPAATVTAPLPSATPEPTRPPGEIGVIGLFTEPRPSPPVTTRALPAAPASAFAPWDGVSTMLYDIAAMGETNLGPGTAGSFSPDGSKMAWVAGGATAPNPEVKLYDLKTLQTRSLGPGRTADWFDNNRIIAFLPGGNNRGLINIVSGQREPIPSVSSADAAAQTLADGTRLRRRQKGEVTFPGQPYGAFITTFTLLAADGRTLLEFDAFDARPAGPGELVVATTPLPSGTINIFIVKVTTGQAQFIATSRFSPPSWPLGASADFVVWTEGYCGAAQGKTRVYDRRGGIVTELDQSLWVTMTPGGLIGAGEFGPAALIDPRSLQYVAVLPSKAGQTGPAVDVSWSPDFKYASRGQAFGHGGYCGG